MDWERPVNFSYILEDGKTMALNQDAYLEMCGGWSRAWTPHSFKLNGNKSLDGNKNLDYPFFSAKPWIRNRTLQIRNGGNDNYCRIKDPALQTIVQTSGIDVDLQSYQPVHEFINGQYIGVLNVREPNNKHYVYANYGWDEEDIDQFEISPDSFYVQKCGTEEAYQQLLSLSANAADSETYEEIKQLLDVDEYIAYMALEFYLGGSDWTRNNVKAFRNRNNGKFRFVMFDLDSSLSHGNSMFSNFFNMEKNYTFDLLYPSNTKITTDNTLVTLFRQLLQNDEFRNNFVDAFCIAGGSVFTPERCTSIIDSMTAIIGPAIALTGESPYGTANDLKNAFNNRLSTMMNAVKNESLMQLGRKTMMNAVIKSNVYGAKLFINNTNIPTGSFNGKLFAPTTLKVIAPAGYTFKGWFDTDEGSCLSTNTEINIPTNDFNYTATFEEMPDAEKLSKGITPVRINEVSASNSVYVNDYFKKNDWIELVNTTNEPQDVEGMYLTDNLSTPTKYQITKGSTQASTIIPPHGHLLIWCDKLTTDKELHASFKLGAEGDELQLMSADQSWTDRLSYPTHSGNQSVGRFPDGCDDIYLFGIPSIGKANQMSIYAFNLNPFLLGDVNGDGFVNITDVTCLVNYIMNPESTTIIFKATDINSDGMINITDAVGIVNIILGN